MKPPPDFLSTAAEEVLFQRFIRRIKEAGEAITPTAVSEAAEAAASTVRTAAEAVGAVADQTANLLAEAATDASGYIQKYGMEALSALGLLNSEVSGPITVAAATKIVESRRKKDEPIAQVLFRVPEHLRDDVKRLAWDEKRQMDELLTEAVLDLLLKHGRMPKAFQKNPGSQGN